MNSILSLIPERVKRGFVESIYSSIVNFHLEYKEGKTNNGKAFSCHDRINSGVDSFTTSEGMFCHKRKAGPSFEYVFVVDSEAKLIYLPIRNKTLLDVIKNRVSNMDSDDFRKCSHYSQGFSFLNDKISERSLTSVGELSYPKGADEFINPTSSSAYDYIEELSANILVGDYSDYSVVFITYERREADLTSLKAVIPSSIISDSYVDEENWEIYKPVYYDDPNYVEGIETEDYEHDNFGLELQDSYSNQDDMIQLELELDLSQDNISKTK